MSMPSLTSKRNSGDDMSTSKSPATVLSRDLAKKFKADRLSAWKQSAVKTVAFAQSNDVHILGIMGVGKNSGAEDISISIAHTYAGFGQRVLFIDASKKLDVKDAEIQVATFANLLEIRQEITNNVHYVDLRNSSEISASKTYFEATFKAALEHYDTIVVNIPETDLQNEEPAPYAIAIGAACNSVFLVCVTGRTKKNEIQQILEGCKVSDTHVGGILLNDQKLLMNTILS